MISASLKREALRLLDREGALLRVAREVSAALQRAEIRGAVIGGVATVLHGHLRTRRDVAVFIDAPLNQAADALRAAGVRFSRTRREFTRQRVPVHFVRGTDHTTPPRRSSRSTASPPRRSPT